MRLVASRSLAGCVVVAAARRSRPTRDRHDRGSAGGQLRCSSTASRSSSGSDVEPAGDASAGARCGADGVPKPGLRLLARAAARDRRRDPRRVLGSRAAERRRLALHARTTSSRSSKRRRNGQWPAATRCSCCSAPRAVEAPASPDADAARDRARARALRRPRRHGIGPLPRAQPLRRSAARRWDQERVGLRAAVGGRGDLGQRRAAEGQRLRARPRARASTPAAGSRWSATVRRDGGTGWIEATVAPSGGRADRDRGRSRRAAAVTGTAAGCRLQRADRRRNRRRPRPPSGFSSRATWTAETFQRPRARRATSATPPAAAAARAVTLTLQRRQPRARDQVRRAARRFQTVKVRTAGGITAIDSQPLAPWSLTFRRWR